MVSPSLKIKILRHVFFNVMNDNPVFLEEPELLMEMTSKLDTQIYLPETFPITQGETADKFYLIAKGELTIWIQDLRKE